jgi:ABC-type Fe3+-hydroxamate transport system substrate-binding protein
MRLLICGSRNSDNYEIPKFIEKVNEINPSVIISGEARGFDTLAKNYARVYGIAYEGYPADWKKHGKAAGPIRNKQMLDEGKPDKVLAFLAPNSRGTRNMISQAEKAGIPVEIVDAS